MVMHIKICLTMMACLLDYEGVILKVIEKQ